jgi:hypothetical protein
MIRLKNRIALVLLSVLLLIFLAGCMSETETFIQGYWYRGNVHFMDQWFFDRGNFNHIGGVIGDNEINSAGLYHILDLQDDRITLELDDKSLSFNDERTQIVIKLDRESDTISIRSQIYERILP